MVQSKFISIVLLLLVWNLSISCNSDEESNTADSSSSWTLVNLSGGLMGVNQNYEEGEVVWVFDASTQTLDIQHNYTPTEDEIIPFPVEDSYAYEFIEQEGQIYLVVEQWNLGIISQSAGQITLDNNVAADGFAYIFTYY